MKFLKTIVLKTVTVFIFTLFISNVAKSQTALVAGDIAITGYKSFGASATVDEFSFVLLSNITSSTVIRFTDNAWGSDGVFRAGEQTITWTANSALVAGQEIRISGLTPTLASGAGTPGVVTGTALSLSANGDQIIAYQSAVAGVAPFTFVTAIHMNVYNGLPDPSITTAAAWDALTAVNQTTNSSAIPTGLTTGTNAIWIGIQGNMASEFDNARFLCAGDLSSVLSIKALIFDRANWSTSDGDPGGFTLPTGCSYIAAVPAPVFTLDPVNTPVCESANTSFTVTVTGATSYQWQVDNGGGFANITDNATYSGATTTTLNITAATLSMNGYLYRNVATNGSGSTNSLPGTLTVTALPVNPTLLVKTPPGLIVADGTNVSATFNAGSGGTGCTDDYRYTTNGGVSYLPYTPGTPISTTGVAAGSGYVFIEGRRAGCSSACQNSYVVLASWQVSPLPVAPTTLAPGDIAFSAYTSTTAGDDFSFVLLKNIGANTIIRFTDNAWTTDNAFRTGEQTVSWTSNAAYPAGTEIRISGTTATLVSGSSAGTVVGTQLSLSVNGDQIIAYQSAVAGTAPFTFLSAIHMNVYNGGADPSTTTAAAWDALPVATSTTNSSALPTGLTTGVNAIWIGTQGVIASEFDNARFGNCAHPAVPGSIAALRAALNNQANWIRNDLIPPGFTVPTGCNYLSVLCPTITVTNPVNTNGTLNVAFSETFTSTGGVPTVTFTTSSTLPTGVTLSAAGVLSGTPTLGGTFPIVVVATDGAGCTGTGTTYNLVIACPPAVLGTATPSSQTICSGATITTIALAGVPGAVYNWTRDNNVPVTGIAASGAGDISGTLTNTTSAPVTVTFTITPVASGCNQTPYTATVLVNPTPGAVATPSSQTICSGATITTIALTGAVSGTVYNWTRDNTGSVTGIAASGSGDISGALTNTTTAPVTVTFTITPTANSCPGTAITATVVVNPIPDATATPLSQSRCSGQAITPILVSGAVGGTTFNWTRDNFPTIGGSIPASGSGNISGTLVNNTGSPVTVTFTITPTANSCPGAPITTTVTVNPLPLATITNGNQFACKDDYTLIAAPDPNYTYAWGRSLFTNPFTPLGTGQTQVTNVSGNYLLTVTNQYGCTDTAMTSMNIADYRFDGTLAAGDAAQTGRLNRFAVLSTCAAPKACPGIFTSAGSRLYDSYTVTNPSSAPVCATIGIVSYCATNIFAVAYTGSYNPASLCTNYLADGGSSFSTAGYFEATIPANGTIVVVVHEVNTGTGCAGYTLTVDVPREAAGITATPSATVCSGTPVTLTSSAANSYLWTPGGATTQSIVVNPPVGPNNYSVALGYGNFGCSDNAATVVTVSTTPNVNAVANQYFCAGTSTTAIPFTGLVPGTTFNWTNTNTAVGLGASGSGDIPSFIATNATAAPISGTVTVTPVNGSCTGTPITFTITVSPVPSIISVTDDDVCEPGGVVNLSATGTGTINWWNAATGGVVVNTGTTFNPNITATTTYYVDATTTSGPQNLLAMAAQSNTFPGNVRGYWFTAPTNFVITSLSVPTTASPAGQSIAVVKFNGNTPPPVFSATTNAFTTLFLTRDNAVAGSIPVNIPVAAGEVIGFLGYRGTINSYAPGDYNTTIAGFPVQLQRLGMQFPLTTTDPRDIWREFGPTTSISRIEFEYSSGQNCVSAPRVPVTGTVFTVPVPTTTPASQTVCSGPITTIVLASQVPGTTFAWTRDNNVNVTGIAANGTGDISGTLTNTTTVPQTVTFTITATSPDGCIAAPVTATVNVQAVPTITCPAAIIVSNDANQCGAVATYSPTITGIPVPTVTYTFSGATTASGSGNGSGSFFNIGTTTVTITATNACGSASCTFTVTVNDTQNPTITCPAPLTVSCASAVPVAAVGSVTAADNCPGVVVTHTGDVISGQTCANRYTVTRTYRATDVSGNFVECTQIITVNDQTAPIITCPAPITVSCAANVPAVNIASVTATDNCAGVITITHVGDVISAQTCTNRFTITRTYRATDVCGNFAECTQIITVNDQTPPVLTCPAPVTVSCAAAVPPVNIASVTGVSDNCAGAVIVTHQGDVISAQTCANRFTIARTYRATDVCGNFAECTQIITVNDQTAPVVTCPAAVTVSCAAAVPAVNIASVTATDNCAGVITITHVGDVISNQTCLNRFTITRTYRATDVCGNSATCTQIITVNDQTAPVITCSPNLTATTPIGSCTAVVNFTVTATDNCAGPVTVVSSPASGSAFPIGVTTVTSTATDACGNSSTCTFTVTVLDGQLPVISSQPANRTICSGLNASFSVTATNVVTYQWQQWNGNAWVNITGANAATFTLNSVTVSQNTNTYRVVLNGLCTVVNSNAATLYVNPPSTVTIAAAPPAILPNQTTTLTATGVPPGGTYAWTLNGAAVAGVTGAVLGPLTINQLGTYRVVYTSPDGCISTSTDLTITGAVSSGLWVYPNPNFGQFQVRFYNALNEAATINVYDALGQKIYQRSLVTGNTNYTQIDIDLGFKANGIYIVELVNGAGQRIGTKRINVQSK